MLEFAFAIGRAVVVLLWFIWTAIRIVAEYQRLVVFRLGRCIGQKGPGLVILLPVIDRAVRVDLREQFLEIAHQTCITKVAEGEKQAAIFRAEGDRQASILRAEGFSLALEKIYTVARGLDAKTMGLQYLEALKALGASPATKIIFPLELTQLLRPFVPGAEDGK